MFISHTSRHLPSIKPGSSRGGTDAVAALTVGRFWENLSAMQTTIQLDGTLLNQATKLAKAKGYDLSHLIEETLRDKIAPKLPVARQPFFRLTTVGGPRS